MAVTTSIYGTLNGATVHCFTIENAHGTRVCLLDRGATLDRWYFRGKDGNEIDVIVGHDTLEGHVERGDYQGVTVGRYANRIAGGSFEIDGRTFELTKNEKGKTCLHGGGEFSFALWKGEPAGDKSVTFTHDSPDGAHGFPGAVKAAVTYTLSDADELTIQYRAVSDKKTVLNFTNHSYFNLNGIAAGGILGHTVQIFADRFTPIDEDSIPTGKLKDVKGTCFTFLEPKTIGQDIGADCKQLKNGNGYDHNFCLNGWDGTLRRVAVATGDKSGIVLTVCTDQPGLQLYSGNFLNGTVIGKDGIPLTKRCAFCLETQVYPDSPHHPEWPRCVYDAGEEYRAETVYALSLAD